MKLPNGKNAFIANEKLVDYCLNLHHPRGRHKARLFKSRLGITRDNVKVLRQALLLAAATAEASLVGEDQFGRRFEVSFPLNGRMGSATVKSYWMIRHGEENPRLLTCYTF